MIGEKKIIVHRSFNIELYYAHTHALPHPHTKYLKKKI